jgi:hypothetical protein
MRPLYCTLSVCVLRAQIRCASSSVQVCGKVSFINFALSSESMEAQLLHVVSKTLSPALEARREALLTATASMAGVYINQHCALCMDS